MFSNRTIHALAALALGLLIAADALSQNYAIDWFTVDGCGAANSAAGGFTLSGTIGQPDAGSFGAPMSGGGYSLVGGFWPVAENVCRMPGDLDLDALRNGVDVQYFVNCLVGVNGANCACADISGNGEVGVEDVPAFVAILLGA